MSQVLIPITPRSGNSRTAYLEALHKPRGSVRSLRLDLATIERLALRPSGPGVSPGGQQARVALPSAEGPHPVGHARDGQQADPQQTQRHDQRERGGKVAL